VYNHPWYENDEYSDDDRDDVGGNAASINVYRQEQGEQTNDEDSVA